ncbi:MAG: tRNA-dihydrouridine synthase family protein [Nanoarchaeota archaeon]|nr:tRNA-dihydrouridine synthase family protein [Nanoarchaeota archaeon]MBU1052078.1 tRNA-dihydrouridine synthase family protein [Nanoarchaeota archaeon]MBU1988184.1 tRNA-dihydrouridine synthase family protein [Nanoarchaeota archaeon]
MKPLQIGSLKLKSPLVLAPMVDVTDLPYRLLCCRAGAALAFTEMIYVDALLHENKKTLNMVKTCKEDSPLGLQITGDRLEEFERFVSRKELWKKFDLIDLNCGCPSDRIVGNQAGSFLLKEPEKIASIIKILKLTKKPITVKVRLGFDKNNVLEVARIVEKAGADALTVHCRLVKDGNDKKANWSWLGRVKKVVSIPIIGNGDVFNGAGARAVLDLCDGVMVGRGAIGNPLVFTRILNYLEKGKEEDFDVEKNLEIFKEYLKLEKKYYGENVDLGKVKYVGGKFLKGFKGVARLRGEFHKLKTIEEIEGFARGLQKKI